jgi:cobalt/nickel transport protein
MLFPDGKMPVGSAKKVVLTYRWGHPFEHDLFDAEKPIELVVVDPTGEKKTIDNLKEYKTEGKTGYRFAFERPSDPEAIGDYVFAATTPEVFMPEEAVIRKDTVKVVVHMEAQKGWDRAVGLPFELIPLTRPYGLEPGMVFQAQAVYDGGKSLAGAMVEVERYNDTPPDTLPPDEQRTRAVKTDPNGILTCTLTDPGWWCITAHRDGGKAKHDGKQYSLQLRTTFWVYVETKDDKLVAAIKAAIANEVEPGKIEAAVGTKATLNTIRKDDATAFALADIAADAASGPALPDRKTIRYVAYWVRPVEGRNPRIVGIVWPNTGKLQLFYGELLPPG